MAYQATLGIAGDPLSVAAGRVRRFYDEHRPDYLYVEWSGGKDSTAALLAAVEARIPFIAVYLQIAGQTLRENVEAVRAAAEALGLPIRTVALRRRGDLRRAVEEVVLSGEFPAVVHGVAFSYYTGRDFWYELERRGWPFPGARAGRGYKRWCCTLFKSKWLDERPRNGLVGGRPVILGVSGIKWADSPWRRRRYAAESGDLPVVRVGPALAVYPLIDMGDGDVVVILRSRPEVYRAVMRQYELYGVSPNCAVCPFTSYRTALRIASRMHEGWRRFVRERLEGLEIRGRFAEETIGRWLRALEEAEKTSRNG